MIASCGMRARRLRMVENTNAPRKVNARLTQYANGECGSPPVIGRSSAIVAPNAAIWANDRSTKITPRSTTWTPKYAWMPVSIRLATNGAAKNWRTVVSMLPLLFRAGFLDRVDQQVEIVVEKFEVVCSVFCP